MTLTESYLNLLAKGNNGEQKTQKNNAGSGANSGVNSGVNSGGGSSVNVRSANNTAFQSFLEAAGNKNDSTSHADFARTKESDRKKEKSTEKKTDNAERSQQSKPKDKADDRDEAVNREKDKISGENGRKHLVSNNDVKNALDAGKQGVVAEEVTDDVTSEAAVKVTETGKISTEAVEATDGEEVNELSEAEDALAEEIAGALGITKDAVMQILAQLNMTPVDLTQPENMSAFVQKLYNVESKVELLSIPEVQETYKALKNVVDKFAGTGETPVEFAKIQHDEARVEKAFNRRVARRELAHEDNSEDAVDEKPVLIDLKARQAAIVKPVVVEKAESHKTTEGNAPEIKAASMAGLPEVPFDGENTAQNEVVGITQSQTAAKTQVATTAARAIETSGVEIAQVGEIVEPAAINPAVFSPNQARAAFATAVKMESVRNINTQDVINQIVEQMKVEVKADTTSEIRITLRPEHLGDVTMKITTQNGIVTAQFVAESQRIREVIEAGFAQLRQSLQEQGVMIDQLSVSVGQNGRDNEPEGFTGGRGDGRQSGIEGIDGIEGLDVLESAEADLLDAYTVDYRI